MCLVSYSGESTGRTTQGLSRFIQRRQHRAPSEPGRAPPVSKELSKESIESVTRWSSTASPCDDGDGYSSPDDMEEMETEEGSTCPGFATERSEDSDEGAECLPAERAASDASTSKPNFSGEWVCSGVEGDWGAYLKETGVAWTVRTLAAGMGFGVGVQSQEIVQTADTLEVCNVVQSLPPRRATVVSRLDGCEETSTDLEGRPTKFTTRWEGPALITTSVPISAAGARDSGGAATTARRFLSGDRMCTERETPSGLVVRRWYTRRQS